MNNSRLNSSPKPHSSEEWLTRLKTINNALSLYNNYAEASQLITCMGLVSEGHYEMSKLQAALITMNQEEEQLIRENTELATKLTRLMNKIKAQQ